MYYNNCTPLVLTNDTNIIHETAASYEGRIGGRALRVLHEQLDGVCDYAHQQWYAARFTTSLRIKLRC